MPNRLLSILTIVALFATIHAAPAKAQQCACVPVDVLVDDMATDYFPRASLIAFGTAGSLSGDTAQVTVIESFKGTPAGETTGVRSVAGECSYEIAPPGSDHFILALTAGEDGTPVTNRCTTFAAESAEAAQLSAAARAAMPPPTQETPTATEEATPAETEPATSPTAEAESSPTPDAGETPDATDDEGRSTFWAIVAVVSVAAAAVALAVALWMVIAGRRGSGGT